MDGSGPGMGTHKVHPQNPSLEGAFPAEIPNHPQLRTSGRSHSADPTQVPKDCGPACAGGAARASVLYSQWDSCSRGPRIPRFVGFPVFVCIRWCTAPVLPLFPGRATCRRAATARTIPVALGAENCRFRVVVSDCFARVFRRCGHDATTEGMSPKVDMNHEGKQHPKLRRWLEMLAPQCCALGLTCPARRDSSCPGGVGGAR